MLPADVRCYRTVDPITVFNKQPCVCAVERPATCSVADHPGAEDVFESIGDRPDLSAHDCRRVLNQIRQSPKVILRQTGVWWIIPGMQMHTDFRLAASECIRCKLAVHRTFHHFPVCEPGWLESVPFTQLLEAWQKMRVPGGDGALPGPQVVTFCINGDQKSRPARLCGPGRGAGRCGTCCVLTHGKSFAC